MGIFHCPFGCPHHEAEGCIDCGLCSAATHAAMIEASKKIREHLKANAKQGGPVQKIAICGKGGVGKSTIITLMANVLTEQGYRTLVLDTDESNPGLHRMFGFESTPRPLYSLKSRFSYRDDPGANTFWIMLPRIQVTNIPKEYLLFRNGLWFLMVGKIDEPFQGCACSMADVTRGLVARLSLEDNEIILIDMEAGVESFGRGVERSAELVLAIVEPSFESMVLAEKIVYMAEGMGIDRVGAILNKVSTEESQRKMIAELKRRNIQALGTVHFDSQIYEAGFEGRALGESRAKEEMADITHLLLNVVQQTAPD